MKSSKLFALSLLSLVSLSPLLPGLTQKAHGLCVAVDVNTQVALRGTKESSHQENNVAAVSTPDCFGNVSTSVGTSVGRGDSISQTRNSTHILEGAAENVRGLGLEGETIFVPVNNQVDIYVPAYDSEYMEQMGVNQVPGNPHY